MPTYNAKSLWLATTLLLSSLLPAPWTIPTANGNTNASPESTLKARSLKSSTNTKLKRSAPISIPIHKRASRASQEKRGGGSRGGGGEEGAVEIARAVLERDAWRMRNLMGPGGRGTSVKDQEQEQADMKGKDKRASWETLPISSYHGDAFYYASVQFGTPAQTIDLLLDTGSSDLWVTSSTCSTCNQSLVMPYYDGSKSSFVPTESSTFLTSSSTANLSYADGSDVSGTVVRDTIGLGSYTVPNQTFILATHESVSFGVSGILGIAFPSLSRTNSTPWWLNALDQFEQPEMSFFLTEWNNPSAGTNVVVPGGQFTLGGRNSSLYDGEIQFVPITNERWWTIPIRSMILSNTGTNTSTPSPTSTGTGVPSPTSTTPTLNSPPTTLNFTDQTAVIDTGTTLLYGPPTTVLDFYNAIPGSIEAGTIDPQLQGYYAIPCASTTNAKIQFSDTASMILPATNLMWLSLNEYKPGYCITALLSTTSLASFNSKFIGPNPSPFPNPFPSSPKSPSPDANEDSTALAPTTASTWLLGDAFLKSTYTVFRKGNGTLSDPPSVGFAPIKGVNYQADGNAIIGVGGDGVYGGVGNAGGPVITGGAGGGGSGGGGPTPTPGGNMGAAQTDSEGGTGGTVYVTVSAAGRRWGRGLIGVVAGVVLLCAVW